MILGLEGHDFKKCNFNHKNFEKKEDLNLKVTINRGNKCLESSLTNTRYNKNIFVFIQTDKAIYKPGDDIKYRILILNRELKPMIIKNLNVVFITPTNVTISESIDLSARKMGFIELTFKLPSIAPLGSWKIKASVLNKIEVSKTFKVEKYKLPLYELYITAPSKVALTDKEFEIEIKALYSFGSVTTGKARIEINFSGARKFFREVPIKVASVSCKIDIRMFPKK